MIQIIDAKGLACPQPVLLTKKALEQENKVTVVVDNEPAVENIRRLGTTMGCTLQTEKKEDGTFLIHLSREAGKGTAAPLNVSCATGPLVIVISSDRMGRGDDELGYVLIRSFIHTMLSLEPLPQTVIFYNTGVRLTVKESEVLDDLKKIEAAGVSILVCGTCLNYFGITKDLSVGVISNMYDIASTMAGAGRLVVP
ncbi:MAG: sulfurtransferase-like selenium metabolism protein YedF [Deltaproteobacteria bacterium]|nr:sulfurtransferase-like selenium metabolism protein YedF [Deltaproteobacteria bacterium]